MRMHYKPVAFDNHPVSRKSDYRFCFLMQRAVLLGLKETGQLNEMQHRQAEETLLKQYRAYTRECTMLCKDD